MTDEALSAVEKGGVSKLEFPVFHHDKEVGLCWARDLGLYWDLDCDCALLSDRVERLYAGTSRLGVLEREGERLTLRRRVSKSSVPSFPPDLGILTLTPPRQEIVFDCTLPPAVRFDGKLWYPAGESREFPCMPLFCFFTLEHRNGNPFWTIPTPADAPWDGITSSK